MKQDPTPSESNDATKDPEVPEIPDLTLFPGLIQSREYLNDVVKEKEMKYYVFPFSVKDNANIAVVLNKTHIFGEDGKANGNCMMVANVQYNINDNNRYKFSTWQFPKEKGNRYKYLSNNGNEHSDLIHPDSTTLKSQCKFLGADDCALVIGVEGKSSNPSSFRLKGFYGNNMLELNKPTNKTAVQEKVGG